MKYIIEVDENMNTLLNNNAALKNMSVESLIIELLKRYVIDAHIMEQEALWESGAKATADIDLDWANL